MANDFQDRFVVILTGSQSTMTILELNSHLRGVKISLRCKYNVFPCILLQTSTIIIIIIIMLMIMNMGMIFAVIN